jgi:hypothetical protein
MGGVLVLSRKQREIYSSENPQGLQGTNIRDPRWRPGCQRPPLAFRHAMRERPRTAVS